jgi:hypothetical protein
MTVVKFLRTIKPTLVRRDGWIVALLRSLEVTRTAGHRCRGFFSVFGALPQGAVGDPAWKDTFLSAPKDLLRDSYTDLFTGQTIHPALDRDARQTVCPGDFCSSSGCHIRSRDLKE